MSSIDQMSIQGIRSYGPRDHDTQVIKFFSPVTLIVGQNGSGKTTVIECLKYVTTSDMPPNTKGASFVFDPKLIDEVETKGRIKLYFKDTSGMHVQVQKNLSSTQKAKKVEFRTLETIISRYNNEKKLISTITSKCINADAEVVNAFGVNKSVLEHVIFCHQEDSNWPLSDGKLLKTRFDEIFSATKYIKTLDILRKIRLEKQQIVKQQEIEKKHLEGYKVRADQLNRDLEEQLKKRETLQEKKTITIGKLEPIKKQLDFYFQESAKIFEIKSHLDKIETEKTLLEKQIKELLYTTKDCLFTGSEEELREYVKTFTTTTNKMRKEQEETLNIKIDQLNSQLKNLNSKKFKFNIEIGALENKYRTYLEKKEKLRDLITNINKQIESDETDEMSVSSKLQIFVEEFENETKRIEQAAKQREKNLQGKIEAERDLKSKLDQNISNKTESIKKSRRNLDQIEDELKMISGSDKLILELVDKISEYERKLSEESRQLVDVNQVKKEISKIEDERNSYKRKEAEIEQKINKYHANSKFKTEMDLLKKDKKTKEDQIRKMKHQISDELEEFFPDVFVINNNSDLKRQFESELRNLQNEIAKCDEKYKEVDKRLCSSELKRKMLNDEYRLKEKKLRECEDKLLQLNNLIQTSDDIENFDSILEKSQNDHKSFLDEKGFLNGVDKTYKRFLTQLQNEQSCDDSHQSCPVCMRVYKDQDEINDTINSLKKYSSKLPEKIKDFDSKITQTKQNIDKMISMKGEKETYDKIKNYELINLKKDIDNLDKNVLPKLKEELKEESKRKEECLKRKVCSDSLQNEIVLIDKYVSECADLDRKIRQLSGSVDNKEDDLNVDELNEQKTDIQETINRLNDEITDKQKEINQIYACTDRINVIKDKLNEVKARKNEVESKQQKRSQLLDKKSELMAEINENEDEIERINKSLKQSQAKLADLMKQRDELVESNKDLIDERLLNLSELKNSLDKLEELISATKTYENEDDASLTKLKKEIKQIDGEERQISAEIDKNRAKLDEVKSEITRCEIKQRELMDNMKLMEKRKELVTKTAEYNKKKEELEVKDSDLDLKNFKTEQKKLEMKQSELMREYNEINTSLNTMEGRIQTIKEELNLDNYKDALEKYMVCVSDLRVLELSVQDIERYSKALDRAIMNYHAMKMQEINKSIKQLWRQVYRGNDIDYVEIRSEEENATGEAAQTKTRKTYNYRVVLIKGDTALDMRGRCSAGQKVLASIIIRLALAETFCLNSGILALDEPTTNLDRENIESLASALVEIIKTRSSQKNFQLIIITHDEDFVEMLGRSEYMDQFYRVQKDENGFSRISRRSNYETEH